MSASSSTGTGALPWKRILITTDFSQDSLAAWTHAKALALVSGATVTALHVAAPAFEGLRIQTSALHDEMKHAATTSLGVMVKENLAGLTGVSVQVREGRAASIICDVAKESGADLIVISSHGHSGLKHVLLGSVVADVVRHAPCAVLVVPAGGR